MLHTSQSRMAEGIWVGHIQNLALFLLSLFPQDVLLVLAENADFCADEGRSVAFRRAGSVLKALPQAVHKMEDLQGLPCLGGHSQRVIKVRLFRSSQRG